MMRLFEAVLLAVLLAAPAHAAEPVTARPLSGEPVKGELTAITTENVTLAVDGTSRTLSSDQLQRVEFSRTPMDSGQPRVLVELTDGSRVWAESFTVRRSNAAITADSLEQEIPTRIIRSVLLRDQGNNAELHQQWRAFVEAEHEKDVLVYRREVNGEPTLDILEGVVYDITADEVDFEFDGERQTLNRGRIEGVIYFHVPGTTAARSPVCRVVDVAGSGWMAHRLQLDGERLKIETPAGLKAELSLARIQTLDYATGNMVYLSELAWENFTHRPLLGGLAKIPSFRAYYKPQRDRGFGGHPLRLGGTTYDRGLSVCSHTEITYRLPAVFRRFRALVGFDDRVRGAELPSGVMLTVQGDDKTLFEQPVNVEDGPSELDVDVTGVRRLKIIVGYGRDGDVADYLDLCDARLTK